MSGKIDSEKAAQINEAVAVLDNLQRTAKGQSKIFADRYRQIIANVYSRWIGPETGDWVAREGKSTEVVDKLLEMGFEQAIYGRGRIYLRK